ncbi:MAG: hypothetical protein Q8R37_00700, partial [Nanoarchaeota archaeon]|nr:hypothetical protein [Nanoarchaeota archaeon]
MAEDDLYGSKRRYERFVEKMDQLAVPLHSGHYYCKNPANLKYFHKVITYFEAKDLSYIRRNRVFHFLRLITYVVEKDLVDCDREDIDRLVAFSHRTHKTAYSKGDAVKEIKIIWKMLFPERDHLGRIDETRTPYVVRHLSRAIDRSKEKLRNDRLTWDEFGKLVNFFGQDKRLQAYLTLAVESLARPQELLYTRIKDYEFHDHFARVWVSEHGKEGTG